MTAGLQVQDPLVAVGEGIFEVEGAQDLVAVRDIPFHSMCEHHLLPFSGTAHVAYFPDGRVLGLSKFARLLQVPNSRQTTSAVHGWAAMAKQLAICIFCLRAVALPLTPVSIGKDGGPAWIGGPEGAVGVVVVPEIGATDLGKDHASKIAEEGQYRVLLVDLFQGRKSRDHDALLGARLGVEDAVERIGHAAFYLKAHKSPKVGIVGFCMGGAITLQALSNISDLSCGVSFLSEGSIHGISLQPPSSWEWPEEKWVAVNVPRLAAKPLQGHFGALSPSSPNPEATTAILLQEKLRAAGADARIFVYESVGHSFMDSRPDPFHSFEERQDVAGYPPFDPHVAAKAWRRLFDFLGWHLAGRAPPERPEDEPALADDDAEEGIEHPEASDAADYAPGLPGTIFEVARNLRAEDAAEKRKRRAERLSQQFAEALDQLLSPKAVAVSLEDANHCCMSHRGASVPSSTRTLVFRGMQKDDPDLKQQLLLGISRGAASRL
ncbi:unnamed protein product [Effrenium voratum]|nr:unnamed protein product [Effrenium voratum]